MLTDENFFEQLNRDIEGLAQEQERLRKELMRVTRRLDARKSLLRVEQEEKRGKSVKPSSGKRIASIMAAKEAELTTTEQTVRQLAVRVLKDNRTPVKLNEIIRGVEDLKGRKLSVNGVWLVLRDLVSEGLVEKGRTPHERGMYRYIDKNK